VIRDSPLCRGNIVNYQKIGKTALTCINQRDCIMAKTFNAQLSSLDDEYALPRITLLEPGNIVICIVFKLQERMVYHARSIIRRIFSITCGFSG
jgi:hypothetical protein